MVVVKKKNSVVIILAADRLENSNVLHGWPGKSDVGDRMEGKEAALLALWPLERPGAKPETSAKWPPTAPSKLTCPLFWNNW